MQPKPRLARRAEVETLEGKQLLSSLSATHPPDRAPQVVLQSASSAVTVEANVYVHVGSITNYYLQFRGGGYRFLQNFNMHLSRVGAPTGGSVTARDAVGIFLEQLYADTGLTGPAAFPPGVTVQTNSFTAHGSVTTFSPSYGDDATK
jgi:hypothetical protein